MKCKCGNEAIDTLVITNKQGDDLSIPFCEEHRSEVEKAMKMLYAEGMGEL